MVSDPARTKSLLDLVTARRELRGERDLREVLGERIDARERDEGIRAQILEAWDSLEPARALHLHGLLALESAWGERALIVEDVAFDLGYQLGAVEARLEGDHEVTGPTADLAGALAGVVADAGLGDRDGLAALVAVLRVAVQRLGREVEDG